MVVVTPCNQTNAHCRRDTALNLTDAGRGLRSGALTPGIVLTACLGRVEASEGRVRAWRAVDVSGAWHQAEALEVADRDAPLWGIPIGVKDIVDVEGLPTTAASNVVSGGAAASDAPVVARLRAAGAVILGKTNTQELAYGVVCAPTSNPHDLARIPGGSSGGSAAALAAGHCLGALGTDTAGSIRIPAALCGVVGLKPRPGIVPSDGVIPLAPSFDVVGPMARTVADVAVLWEVLSGVAVDLAGGAGLRVAFAPASALPALDTKVAQAYPGAVASLRGMVASVREAEMIAFSAFDAPRSAILMWEALEVHCARGWWPARAGSYKEETRGYLEYAETHLSAETVESARAECEGLAARLLSALDDADVLVTPTVPCVAPTQEEAAARQAGRPRRPVVSKLTRIPGPVNVAGLAALSVPCPVGAGLPVGLQLIGRDEETVLKLGSAYEQAAGTVPRR